MEHSLNNKELGALYSDLSRIISGAREKAYQAVDYVLVLRNWLIGKRIFEEHLIGDRSDRYGKEEISRLSDKLTKEYGKGFDRRSLYFYAQFYKYFPEIVAPSVSQSLIEDPEKIVVPLAPQSGLLSWTKYRVLLQVKDKKAREWLRKKHIRSHGASEHCRGMCHHSIITEY